MSTICVIGLETLAVRHSGLNRYVAEYVEALEERGHEVSLVALGAKGVGPIVQSRSSSLFRRLWWTARAAHRSRDAAVLDVHFTLYGLVPALLRRKGQRLVVHFHGPWARESEISGASQRSVRIKAALEKMLYRRADAVVVLSGAFASEVSARYGVSPDVIAVIAPGVNATRFNAAHRSSPATPKVLAVRRLVERTGVDIALRAAALLRDRGISFALDIAGDGPARENLEALRQELGLEDHVHFLGRVDDEALPGLYQAATVTIVPSVAYEGFGLITLESLACGTPVIASNTGGLGEVIGNFDESLLVAPANVSALAERLARALVDHQLPDTEACVAYAAQFSWSKLAAAHEPVLWPPKHRHLRVAFIGHTATASGGELALLRQLPALVDIDPLVILGANGPLVSRLEHAGIRVLIEPLDETVRDTRRADVFNVLRLPRQVLITGRATLRLARLLRREHVDVVHTNTLKAALYGGLAGRIARVPVVWHIRDRIASDYLPRPVVHLVRLLAHVLPTAIVANSETTLATLPHRDIAAVIPSPLDPAMLGSHEQRRQPLEVVMVGRLAPWKGQALFIEAFDMAFGGTEVRGRIVGSALFGEDAYVDALRRQIERSRVSSQLTMVGFCEDVAGEFARASIAVVASLSPEPFGNVVIEAMAAGAAVVAPDAGGPKEVIDDGVTGILFAPGDARSLAGALERLATNEQLRAGLGASAKSVAARYLPEALAPRYSAIYEMIAEPRALRR